MNCATIAEGVIAAAQELQVKVPLVVRMEGTNVEQGRQMLADSGLNIIIAHSLTEAAEKVVAAAKIIGFKMAILVNKNTTVITQGLPVIPENSIRNNA